MLNKILKDFPISRRVRRLIWNFYNLRKRRRVHRDPAYFNNFFATFNKNNLRSLNTTRGLVKGRFQETDYLMNMKPGSYIESSIFLKGIWEPHIAELIASYLRSPGQIVVDVGANIGAVSIPLAKRYPDTCFYLFEPHPQIFSSLSSNCGVNKLSNIKLMNAAVSDEVGASLEFYAQRDATNMGLSSLRRNRDIKDFEIISVASVQLDDVFEGIDKKITVIKIDTQGSELGVLKSAKKTIFAHRPVILFEFESEYFPDLEEESKTRAEILTFFNEFGYELYCLERKSAYLPLVNLEAYFHGDILAVPLSR